MSTIATFPPRPIFRALHAFEIEQGRGAVVAVLFCVHGAHLPNHQRTSDQCRRNKDADHGVAEDQT